jgi:hypothetical protein
MELKVGIPASLDARIWAWIPRRAFPSRAEWRLTAGEGAEGYGSSQACVLSKLISNEMIEFTSRK